MAVVSAFRPLHIPLVMQHSAGWFRTCSREANCEDRYTRALQDYARRLCASRGVAVGVPHDIRSAHAPRRSE